MTIGRDWGLDPRRPDYRAELVLSSPIVAQCRRTALVYHESAPGVSATRPKKSAPLTA
jgi:hypothetical protein